MRMTPASRVIVVLAAAVCISDGTLLASDPEFPQTEAVDVAPFVQQLQSDLLQRRRLPMAIEEARAHALTAVDAAASVLLAPRDATANQLAAGFARDGRYEDALAHALRVLPAPASAEVAAAASAICSYAAWRADNCSAEVRCGDLPGSDASMRGHLNYWRAACALDRGDNERAELLAVVAVDALPLDVEQHDARFIAARARLRLPGRQSAAIDEILELLSRYPEYPHTATLSIELANAEIAIARHASAIRRLERLVWNRPWHPMAEVAVELLSTHPEREMHRPRYTAQQFLDRGRMLRGERKWPDAAVSLLESIALFMVADDIGGADAARYELALNSYDRADFGDALSILEDLATRANISNRDLARWRARTLSRLGHEDDALSSYIEHFTHHRRSDEDRVISEFARDIGRWDEALRRAQVRGETRSPQSYETAFLLYLAGELTAARDAFDALAARSSGSNRSRALYWLGRAQQKLGEREAARATWARAYADNPRNYFGLQAHNRWLELPAPDAATDVPARVSPGSVDFGQIGGSIPSGVAGGFVELPPSPIAADGALAEFAAMWGPLFPRASVAQRLYETGAQEEARRAFRDVVMEFGALDAAFANGRSSTVARPIRLEHPRWEHEIDNRATPAFWWGTTSATLRFPAPTARAALEQYVARHGEIRANRQAIRDALDLAMIDVGEWHFLRRRMIQRGVSGAPDPTSERWMRAYAQAYRPYVEARAREFDVSPFFVWAIMIVESEMNPDSVSSADAFGLLQVIPKTGQRIQIDIGDEEFGIHDLIEPSASIRYGTWYLAQLTHNFRGQELLAAISYNAGPHQMARWMQWRCEGLDLDEMIETVPFEGARRYAQRVYQHLATYAALYYNAPHVYLGNSLNCDVEGRIYY